MGGLGGLDDFMTVLAFVGAHRALLGSWKRKEICWLGYLSRRSWLLGFGMRQIGIDVLYPD